MNGSASLPVLLVPGACLGGWAWREVAGPLRSLGHDVHPVTLTALGERVDLAAPEVDLETHITDVVNMLDYERLHDVVLVGHSYAGIVVTALADGRPERLHAVVYLDTSPLPDGVSIADVQSPEQRDGRGVMSNGWVMVGNGRFPIAKRWPAACSQAPAACKSPTFS